MKARIHVSLKPAVLDPQGKAVANSLKTLGFDEVLSVRQGKYFDIEFEEVPGIANEERLKDYSEKLLANPIIENFQIELMGN